MKNKKPGRRISFSSARFVFVRFSRIIALEIALQKLFCTLFLRMFKNLLGRSALHNVSLVHKEDLIGNIMGKFHLMCDDDHGRVPVRKSADYLEHFAGQFGIERGCLLIETQDIGRSIRARAMATRCCWPPES